MNLFKVFEILPRAVAIIVTIIALSALFLPSSIWQLFEAKIATIYGHNGWVYYEVKKNRETTSASNLFLIKDDPVADFLTLKVGDKMRLSKAKNLRYSPTSLEENKIFLLLEGDCVIATEDASGDNKRNVKDKGVTSGGWIKVATAPCGLF